MNITKSKLEALRLYLSFGTPIVEDSPEFMDWCSNGGNTNFTRKDLLKLQKGAEVFKYLQNILGDVDWELARTY